MADKGFLRGAGEAFLGGMTGRITPDQAEYAGDPNAAGMPINMLENIVQQNDAVIKLADRLVPRGSPDAGELSLADIQLSRGKAARPGMERLMLRKDLTQDLQRSQIKENEAQAGAANARSRYLDSGGAGGGANKGDPEVMKAMDVIKANPLLSLKPVEEQLEIANVMAQAMKAMAAGKTPTKKKEAPKAQAGDVRKKFNLTPKQ